MLDSSQLRKLRKARGLSQQQLADAAGVSRQTVVDAEAGRLTNPLIRTATDFALALGVPVVVLLASTSGGEP